MDFSLICIEWQKRLNALIKVLCMIVSFLNFMTAFFIIASNSWKFHWLYIFYLGRNISHWFMFTILARTWRSVLQDIHFFFFFFFLLLLLVSLSLLLFWVANRLEKKFNLTWLSPYFSLYYSPLTWDSFSLIFPCLYFFHILSLNNQQ